MSNNGDNAVPNAVSSNSQEGEGSSNQTGSGSQTQWSGNSDGNNTNQTGARRARNRNMDRIVTEIKSFKGETTKMNRHVFQLHVEHSNKAQFTVTMEALRIYASTAYKSDIEPMNILCTEL